MTAQTTVRRKQDIEKLLAHGFVPVTDNVDALIESQIYAELSGWPAQRGSGNLGAFDRQRMSLDEVRAEPRDDPSTCIRASRG
jgi:hypothetical protein